MTHILSYNRFFILGLFAFFALTLTFSTPISAQEKQKPKLVEIVLNEKTNNADALKIAKKLNPDIFVIEPGYGTAEHYARYIPLDEKNKTRFLAVTVSDTGYFCTSFGCPTYIYQKLSNNKWQPALSVQSFEIYQDLNTTGNGPDNLISTSRNGANKSVSIWIWNGQQYEEAKQK